MLTGDEVAQLVGAVVLLITAVAALINSQAARNKSNNNAARLDCVEETQDKHSKVLAAEAVVGATSASPAVAATIINGDTTPPLRG